MEILPVSTSNNTSVEDLTLRAGNPIKEVLIMNLPDHMLRRWSSDLIPAASYSLPHAHAQATKTYYKHQHSRIKKAQVQTKIKNSATLIFKIFLKDIKIIKTKDFQGRLLASFQDDAYLCHLTLSSEFFKSFLILDALKKGGVEEEQQLNLLSRTTDLLLPYMLHHWFWSLEASGDFLVKSVCNLIDDILLPKEEVPTRCVNVIPIKINVFAWRLRLDKLPTRLNLSIRGLKIPSILCLLCSILVESTSHIFLVFFGSSSKEKKVGNGEDTFFWDEIWLDKIALKHQYPRLYTLESHKQISVAAKMRHASLDFYYRCAPRGGVEEEQQLNLLSRTTDLLLPYMLHHWFWSLEASGDFLVKSVCNLIDDILLPKEEVPTRCVNVIPIKINVFAWRLHLDKLPTRLNLSIRGLKIPSILCLLCSILVESTSHIFFSCSLARQVRSKVNRWWELDDPDIHSYEEWLLCLITFICLSAWKRFLKAFAM
ncbi:RNA-directed DNA polymerase, eukaryota [Tanacetum coccineum]